ncbi:MAG TPA: hypothetical protein PLX06_08725, partial [Fimbriimonadaceae bacterium]|nr:hypothetical protein [Fimbriimonadaceae bacterium]
NINATLDRFETRMVRDKGLMYGSYWLDDKGQLVLFTSGGKYDLAQTSMFSSLGTPSGPEIDPTGVWPAMMTLDHIWMSPPPRKAK